MQVHEPYLEERLAELERARAWSPRLLARLEQLVRADDEHALFRVNPLSFAAGRGIAADEAVDLFLHAARVGLFELSWNLVCPACSMYVDSLRTLREVHGTHTCRICLGAEQTTLDEFIEVGFTVAPAVRKIALHDPSSSTGISTFVAASFTRNSLGRDGRSHHDEISRRLRALDWLPPAETRTYRFDVDPGVLLGSRWVYTVEGDRESAEQRCRALQSDLLANRHHGTFRPGPVAIELTNDTPGTALVVFANFSAFPEIRFVPFLTARYVLNCATFRKLFETEVLDPGAAIGVRELTLLFTDLKDSTALYDRIGDVQAFDLVRRHFDALAAAVERSRGVIVKTIGDAVMASFCSAADAVRAALAMRRNLDAFNRERSGAPLVLRIGIHRGPLLAVTLSGRLDYFGQTVNIASRVQGVLRGDEIGFTDPVLQDPEVRPLLDGLPVTTARGELRGIGDPVVIHRVGRAADAR